jgi:ribose transport system ATP-binding protein
MSDEAPLLEVTNLSKGFPGVQALDGVSFAVHAGEVHALVGENGAGKSTLLSIMSGLQQADSGEIRLRGNPIRLHGARDGRASGIALVHQELSLCPNMSVAENIFLGIEPHRAGGWVDYGKMNAMAEALLASIHANIDPKTLVERLSLSEQQIVEICRAVALEPKVIVLDEPTASLGPDKVQDLLEIIRKLRHRGLGIIYVSHRLEEVMAIADRITVLRDGKLAGALTRQEASEEKVIRLMVGRALAASAARPKVKQGAMALEVRGLTGRRSFSGVSLSVAEGEILGIAGLMGCHREKLVRALFGLEPVLAGEILVKQQPVTISSPADAIRHGIGFAPADRKDEGLLLGMGVHDNTIMASWRGVSRGGFFSFRRRQSVAGQLVRRLGVKTPSLGARAATLSGGNQQKVVVAKWLASEPRILLFDEPTRGVDVGAKAQIRDLLQELAGKGMAVLLTSSELPELIDVCDRILVMKRGRVSGEFVRDTFDAEEIGRLAVG